jgi:hypothetical protein
MQKSISITIFDSDFTILYLLGDCYICPPVINRGNENPPWKFECFQQTMFDYRKMTKSKSAPQTKWPDQGTKRPSGTAVALKPWILQDQMVAMFGQMCILYICQNEPV